MVLSIWNFLALGLDALAIAAQALTGKALGEGDGPAARALTAAMLRWGVWAGAVIGAVVLLIHAVAGAAFSPDPDVRAAVAAALDRRRALATDLGVGLRAGRGADRRR